MTHADAEKAITSAGKIANGPWLPLWRYGVLSQSEAVWVALKPALEYIKSLDSPMHEPDSQSPAPMERYVDVSPIALVELARAQLRSLDARAKIASVLDGRIRAEAARILSR